MRTAYLARLPSDLYLEMARTFCTLSEVDKRIKGMSARGENIDSSVRERILDEVAEQGKQGTFNLVVQLKPGDGYSIPRDANGVWSQDLQRLLTVHGGVNMATLQLFYSVIIGVWTSFESLCSQLWETTVDLYPDQLGRLSG